MSTALLLLAASAHADRAALEAPCGTFVEATLPTASARFVPIDIAPAFLVGGCGGMDDAALVQVTDADGRSVFSEVLTVASDDQGTVVVDLPQLALEPGRTYTVQVEGDLLWHSWTFETGDSTVLPETQVPTLTLDLVEGWREGDGYRVSMYGTLTPEDRIVRLVQDGEVVTATAYGDVWYSGFAADDVYCATPELRADDGTWVAGDEACMAIEETEPPREGRSGPRGWLGCSSSGALGAFLGPLPLLFLRRRR
jgi:hypothetical protein